MTNTEVQKIAKQTMSFIKSQIKVGMSLQELRQLAESKMFSLGSTAFWYWNIGAFIFSGEETTLSISGKHYQTPHIAVKGLKYGFKKENIYCFKNNKLVEL